LIGRGIADEKFTAKDVRLTFGDHLKKTTLHKWADTARKGLPFHESAGQPKLVQPVVFQKLILDIENSKKQSYQPRMKSWLEKTKESIKEYRSTNNLSYKDPNSFDGKTIKNLIDNIKEHTEAAPKKADVGTKARQEAVSLLTNALNLAAAWGSFVPHVKSRNQMINVDGTHYACSGSVDEVEVMALPRSEIIVYSIELLNSRLNLLNLNGLFRLKLGVVITTDGAYFVSTQRL